MKELFNFTLLKDAAKLCIMGFFIPVEGLLPSVAALVALDIVLGMYVARVIKKEDLTSKKFRGKFQQVAVFGVGLYAMIWADTSLQIFGIAAHYGAKMYIALYVFYELFSILESLGDMGLPIAKEIRGLLLAKKNAIIKPEEENKDGN